MQVKQYTLCMGSVYIVQYILFDMVRDSNNVINVLLWETSALVTQA